MNRAGLGRPAVRFPKQIAHGKPTLAIFLDDFSMFKHWFYSSSGTPVHIQTPLYITVRQTRPVEPVSTVVKIGPVETFGILGGGVLVFDIQTRETESSSE
jgi:hypothetical protein